MTEPWYQEGLQFTCTRCGACCTGEPGFVWLTDEELTRIATLLGLSEHEVRAMHTRWTARGRTLREKTNGDCIYYDRQAGCTIYEARPAQCRTWPFWESNLSSRETWEHTCSVCPGSGQGELIPVEEITRRMKTVRI